VNTTPVVVNNICIGHLVSTARRVRAFDKTDRCVGHHFSDMEHAAAALKAAALEPAPRPEDHPEEYQPWPPA